MEVFIMKNDRNIYVDRICERCGTPFQARQSRVKQGYGRFCTMKCFNIYQRENGKETLGIENGRKYLDKIKNSWIVAWRDENRKQHTTSYSHWWWEQNKGKVPDGFRVSYKDENPLNIEPDNFILLSKEEEGKRISKRLTGKVRSEEHCKNIAKANTGKHHTQEQKLKIADAYRKRWANGDFDLVHKGEHSSRWRGGYDDKYSPEFRHIREFIKDRDNHSCQICGKSVYKSRYGHVHHINGNKQDNDINNLILLCVNCHCLVHSQNSGVGDSISAFRSKLEWNVVQ
jgi:hypothetical protein